MAISSKYFNDFLTPPVLRKNGKSLTPPAKILFRGFTKNFQVSNINYAYQYNKV